jgi:hypothetical protein
MKLVSDRLLRAVFVVWGAGHLVFGFMALLWPRWFFAAVPPWPPFHAGQIQIAAIFDLTLGTACVVGATDVARFAPLAILVGVVGEVGHAVVRIGHVMAGDNPRDDLALPSLMLGVALFLVAAAAGRWPAAHPR